MSNSTQEDGFLVDANSWTSSLENTEACVCFKITALTVSKWKTETDWTRSARELFQSIARVWGLDYQTVPPPVNEKTGKIEVSKQLLKTTCVARLCVQEGWEVTADNRWLVACTGNVQALNFGRIWVAGIALRRDRRKIEHRLSLSRARDLQNLINVFWLSQNCWSSSKKDLESRWRNYCLTSQRQWWLCASGAGWKRKHRCCSTHRCVCSILRFCVTSQWKRRTVTRGPHAQF